jgi:hypothetical protein
MRFSRSLIMLIYSFSLTIFLTFLTIFLVLGSTTVPAACSDLTISRYYASFLEIFRHFREWQTGIGLVGCTVNPYIVGY